MGLLKGNKLQKRLQDLGLETDGTDWDKCDCDHHACESCNPPTDPHDGEGD